MCCQRKEGVAGSQTGSAGSKLPVQSDTFPKYAELTKDNKIGEVSQPSLPLGRRPVSRQAVGWFRVKSCA
jgi:hypothetical protein